MKWLLAGFIFFSVLVFGDVSLENSRSIVHLLNYIASDYEGAVQKGKVISPAEYEEQKEFSRTVLELAAKEDKLQANPKIAKGLSELRLAVDELAPSERIRKISFEVQTEIVQVSGMARSPKKWPSVKHGQEIYSQQCAQCHGATGHGDGPSSGSLDPKPANFSDSKFNSKSPFQFFNAIRLGVPGTSMAAFQGFSDNEIWDLAFYIASLRHSNKSAQGALSHPWSLEQVASLSDDELLKIRHEPQGDILPALVLARTYEASNAPQTDLLGLTEKNLDESFEAFKIKNFQLAKTKAVSAYLDGIEPLEPKLRLNDPNFTVQLETLLSSYRKQIDDRVTVGELENKLSEIKTQLKAAKKVLESKPSSFGVTFSVSVGIFLREALEAALLLITLLGVVKTLGNRTAIYWIHAGWISASLVGLISWFFSGWVMRLSGLRRELLEGSLSFFAVGILLYFGFWLHQKTEIGKWRSFINELVKNALDNKKMFGLALVSFMGVFREAFETVLFLRALLIESPGQETALGLGVLSAFLFVLVASSFAVKYSARLPLKQLFGLSSIIMLFLAFVLVGKSVHAFQEAGVFTANPVSNFIRIDLLGIFPTWESLLSQLALLLVSCYFWLKPKFSVSQTSSANHS